MEKSIIKFVLIISGLWIFVYVVLPIMVNVFIIIYKLSAMLIRKLLHGNKRQYEASFVDVNGNTVITKFWA